MERPRNQTSKRILVAPLDWGLGHATRCIPVIRELLDQQADVVLAGEGPAQNLLKAEFPQLEFVPLRGYDVRYSGHRWSLPFIIASQIPKILSAIQYENERLKEIVKEQAIDGIISDNRYGMYDQELPSVIITHQLLIRTGLGRTADEYLQSFHYQQLAPFSACWVPDVEEGTGLAGELSHPRKLPSIPVAYTGPLSRMKKIEAEKSQHLLILLSGPEPQRTILEEKILEQLAEYKDPVILLRGLPGGADIPATHAHVTVYNHMNAEDLHNAMAGASFVIGRCGYSTVMDLSFMGKKSILIPTPGQTEQEYLSDHLMKQNFAFCIDQEKFRLKAVLDLANDFKYNMVDYSGQSRLKEVVGDFLKMSAG